MPKAKVLIIAGDAVEAQEIFFPYYSLLEDGYEVEVAAPSKKKLYTVVHDFKEGVETYIELPGYQFPWVAKSFDEVKPEEYSGLVIPGGRAPEYMRNHPALEKIVRHFFQENKPVAAICHGPLVLAAYGLLKGRKATSYVAVKSEVVNGGAEYVDSEVVVDGNLVTSRAWPDLPSMMREFKKLLPD